MLHRIKQFYSALTAEVRSEENEFINHYLNEREQTLFFQMSVVDQRHALDVSYLVVKALENRKKSECDRNLVKAALLHDIGKRNGELTLFDRILIVILEKFWPLQMTQWASKGRGGFITNRRHALFIAVHHSLRGAEFLQEIDCEQDIIDLVRDHHQPDSGDWRMVILQDADRKS